jgi:hypothetical protein
MEWQITWSVAVVLIALAAAHLAEEVVAGLRGFEVPRRVGDDCGAAMARASFVAGRIGHFLLLVALAASGVLVDPFWLWLGLGMIAADVAKHVTSSLSARAYTPGLGTSVAYLVYGAWLLGQSLHQGLAHELSDWGAMVIGIVFVAINDLSGRRNVDATG